MRRWREPRILRLFVLFRAWFSGVKAQQSNPSIERQQAQWEEASCSSEPNHNSCFY